MASFTFSNTRAKGKEGHVVDHEDSTRQRRRRRRRLGLPTPPRTSSPVSPPPSPPTQTIECKSPTKKNTFNESWHFAFFGAPRSAAVVRVFSGDFHFGFFFGVFLFCDLWQATWKMTRKMPRLAVSVRLLFFAFALNFWLLLFGRFFFCLAKRCF